MTKLTVDKVGPPEAVQGDRPDQARHAAEPAPLGLPQAADQAPGGGDPARGGPLDQAAGPLHRPRLRRRPHDGPGRLDSGPRFAYAKEMIRVVLDPDCGTGPPRLRRLGLQRPARRGAGQGVHPAHREDLQRRRRARRPAAQRPLLGRLEHALAPGDVPRLLRRDVVDQPRPGRLPRLPAARRSTRTRTSSSSPTARPGPSPGWATRRWSSTSRSRRWRRSSATAASSRRSSSSSRRSTTDGPSPAALGPRHGGRRPRHGEGVGEVRHPARPRAGLADARPEAQGEDPRRDGRPRHLLPRRGDEAPQGVARAARQRRGRRARAGQGPRLGADARRWPGGSTARCAPRSGPTCPSRPRRAGSAGADLPEVRHPLEELAHAVLGVTFVSMTTSVSSQGIWRRMSAPSSVTLVRPRLRTWSRLSLRRRGSPASVIASP